MRAFERGLTNYCPEPREKDKYVFIPAEDSKSALDARVEEVLRIRRMRDEQTISVAEITTDKKQSQSTMMGLVDQHTNRTTLPSQNA